MNIPAHVAVIMDGNGRWATERGLPRVAGHKAGADSARHILHAAAECGVKVLTFYAFSQENWKRPKSEVSILMSLLDFFLKMELEELHRHNVKIRTIGRIEELPLTPLTTLKKSIEKTANNTGLILNLALNYSARTEILDAVSKLLEEQKNGRALAPLDEKTFEEYLYTAGLPDPDLLIRTSGEMRLSNFLLWQLSYAELYITKKYWPDFTKEDFVEALEEYSRRQRRFGDIAHETV